MNASQKSEPRCYQVQDPVDEDVVLLAEPQRVALDQQFSKYPIAPVQCLSNATRRISRRNRVERGNEAYRVPDKDVGPLSDPTAIELLISHADRQ
ncbi:MAG TPA: hypothetical protein VJS11_09155 [Acidobacteriaceae bacterium]|nr:hypothetical protein [Acidobacteriaceae bacterium]